jgi:hypothetical protein
MQRKKQDVDIIDNVLREAITAYPESSFIQSLRFQYHERGGLSKRQLEGLYQKAIKVKSIPSKWLATIEAEMLKKPTKFKSSPPPLKPLYEKDERVGQMISSILGKYPQHKRVIFLGSKFNNNEPLSSTELAELERFYKLLSQLK